MYITYLLLHNKRLQNLGACNNDIYYLAVSVGQESRCTQLDPQIHGLSEAAIQVSAEGCDPGVSGGRIPSQDHSRCCWQYSVPAGSIYQRSQSLVGCWWEDYVGLCKDFSAVLAPCESITAFITEAHNSHLLFLK